MSWYLEFPSTNHHPQNALVIITHDSWSREEVNLCGRKYCRHGDGSKFPGAMFGDGNKASQGIPHVKEELHSNPNFIFL